MENGGLGDPIMGRIGDACISADCWFSDIAKDIQADFVAVVQI